MRMKVITIALFLTIPNVALAHSESECGAEQTACTASAKTLALAKLAYANKCDQPRKDCDPSPEGYTCSSEQIGSASPGNLQTKDDPIKEPDTTPDPPNTSGLVAQAEVGTLGAGWVDHGSYISWGGARLLTTAGMGTTEYKFNVPVGGVYKVNLYMRIPSSETDKTESNDLWVKATGDDVHGYLSAGSWIKAFINSYSWTIAKLDKGHTKSAFIRDFAQGQHTISISGRSKGVQLDRIELVKMDETTTSCLSGGSLLKDGDLLVLAHDNGPDPDDLQALIANKAILDSHSCDIDHIMLAGTIGHKINSPLAGSLSHSKGVYGQGIALDAYGQENVTASTTAALFGATVRNNSKVWIAEGGPSDFTAKVLRLMIDQGYSDAELKKINVVQHSCGTGGNWNEAQTRSDNLALMKQRTTYHCIPNGNNTNSSPDFNSGISPANADFISRAKASRYGAEWAWAFSKINNKVDFSDTVEVCYILGTCSGVMTPNAFADKFF